MKAKFRIYPQPSYLTFRTAIERKRKRSSEKHGVINIRTSLYGC